MSSVESPRGKEVCRLLSFPREKTGRGAIPNDGSNVRQRELRFSGLSAPLRGLVRLCRETGYGRIEDLEVAGGEPILGPDALVLVDIKLDAAPSPEDQPNDRDFVLSAEVVRLIAVLDGIHDGRVSSIEIRAGLPRRIVFERRILQLQC